MTQDERVWARVDTSAGPLACWEWQGATHPDGYGRAKIANRMWLAHRLVWTMVNGDPAGQCVLHRCDNPPCVNPDHLFLGSQIDNIIDMHEKGRFRYFDECPNGHRYEPSNTRYDAKGHRRCETCLHNAWRRHNRRRRGLDVIAV
jgi:hypothetical protein